MRIFDRFFTYRPATSWRDSRHTGLGLSIVKAIVEGYGGTITAVNGERGAQFEIRLPRKGRCRRMGGGESLAHPRSRRMSAAMGTADATEKLKDSGEGEEGGQGVGRGLREPW